MPIPLQVARAVSVASALTDIVRDGEVLREWQGCFPRDIASLTLYGLEIPVVQLQDLTLDGAARYLCALRGDPEPSDTIRQDRPLYGLLHVGPPSNIIFLRQGLSPAIGNYVLAHELGHFLADVFLVQQLWLQALPERRSAILDAFTWRGFDAWLELRGLIKGLPERPRAITGRGLQAAGETSEREMLADLIARELLAPWAIVEQLFHQYDGAQLVSLLRHDFGLSRWIADTYYLDLRNHLTPPLNPVDRLFAPLLQRDRKTHGQY